MRAPTVLLSLALLGCERPEPLTELSCEIESRFWQPSNFTVDLLFVIDRSPAMAPFLPALERNLPALMDVLQSRILDLHVGVVASDLAEDGALIAPPGGNFLQYRDRPDGFAANFDGQLGDALSSIGLLGAEGTLPSRPIAAMRRALSNPANAGFVRDQAFLVVVILSAGDDPDTDDLEATRVFLSTVKSSPWHIEMDILSDPAASRLRALGSHYRGVFTSIYQQDFTDLVSNLVAVLDPYFPPPCLPGDADAMGCTVSEVRGDPSFHVEETLLPACPGPRPCWSVRENPTRCDSGGFEVVVERDEYASPGVRVQARCPAVCAR